MHFHRKLIETFLNSQARQQLGKKYVLGCSEKYTFFLVEKISNRKPCPPPLPSQKQLGCKSKKEYRYSLIRKYKCPPKVDFFWKSYTTGEKVF